MCHISTLESVQYLYLERILHIWEYIQYHHISRQMSRVWYSTLEYQTSKIEVVSDHISRERLIPILLRVLRTSKKLLNIIISVERCGVSNLEKWYYILSYLSPLERCRAYDISTFESIRYLYSRKYDYTSKNILILITSLERYRVYDFTTLLYQTLKWDHHISRESLFSRVLSYLKNIIVSLMRCQVHELSTLEYQTSKNEVVSDHISQERCRVHDISTLESIIIYL